MSETTKKTVMMPAEALPVVDEAEVVVIGGGTAGFIAATAAARLGCKTILIERFGYLGGCTTTTYNTSIGIFVDSNGKEIIKGLAREFLDRMTKEGEAFYVPSRSPQIWPPTTKKVAIDMVTEAGVELLFYTVVIDVVKEGEYLKGVVIHNKGGKGVILGKTFVDASGDADVAAMCGCPFEMTDTEHLQQVSVDYLACGVDAGRVVEWARANRDKLQSVNGLDLEHTPYGAQPMISFVIPNASSNVVDGYYHHVGVMPTVKLLIYNEAVRIQGNNDINPLDPKALSYAEVNGLRGALEHLKYLKENVPGFEGAFVASQNHLGVRESRRIIGDYNLTIDDLKNQKRFDDVVALNCRALDFHLKGTVFKIQMLEGHHDVPLGALLPQGVQNLVVAGRSIAGDHLSQASLRGAATCMATGHAAGVAAAVAADGNGNIRAQSIRSIQDALRSQDAVLATD